MNLKTPKILAFRMLLVGMLFSSSAFAVKQTFTGTVNTIYAQGSQAGADFTTIYLDGVKSPGNTSCMLDETFLSFRLKDDDNGKKQLSVILTAYSMGATVKFDVDDTYKTLNGRCYLISAGLSH